MICRQSDGLPLVTDTDSGSTELEQLRMVAKNLCKRLSGDVGRPQISSSAAMTVSAPPYCYHVLRDGAVIGLTLSDAAASANACFAYLDDVLNEFEQQYGAKVASASRPYCFIRFDLYLQKTKKVFITNASTRVFQRSGSTAPVKTTLRAVMEDGVGTNTAASSATAAGLDGEERTSIHATRGKEASRTELQDKIARGVVGTAVVMGMGLLFYVYKVVFG